MDQIRFPTHMEIYILEMSSPEISKRKTFWLFTEGASFPFSKHSVGTQIFFFLNEYLIPTYQGSTTLAITFKNRLFMLVVF